MSSPTVSVIIPTFNRPEFLALAIRSVLRQTFQDFELIIVDNGSSEATKKTINEFMDERIRYLRIDVNNGVSRARNLAIEHAVGKYVAFLDDDDEWMPDKLARQVQLMERTPGDVGGVYTGCYKIDRSSGAIVQRITPSKRGYLFDELCAVNCIGTASTVLLRRECAMKVGLFDEDMLFGEEYDFWIRVSRQYHFECIGEPLVKYFMHANNASLDYEVVKQGFEAQEKKYGSWFARNRKANGERYLSLGVLFCFSGDMKKGRKALLQAIRLNPFEVKNFYNLGLSWLGHKNFKKFKDFSYRLRSRRVQMS
jgi:glycosyltransferase involved in cell wall biosynthesis